MINSFKNEYTFLSNFYDDNGFCVEKWYQAMKSVNREDFLFVMKSPTAGIAKRRGKQITMSMFFEGRKLDIMKRLVRIKFSTEPLRGMLLSTGDEELIEGNTWGDTYWGVCKGVGENHLGKILMEIREEIKNETK